MKSLVKFSLTALCVSVLAACSSGGGDDSKAISSNEVPAPKPAQSTQNTTNNTTTTVNNTTVNNTTHNNTGNNATSSNTGNTASNNGTTNPPAVNNANRVAVGSKGIVQGNLSSNTLVVDGVSYNLAPPNVTSREFHTYGGRNVELVREVEDNGQFFGFTSQGYGTQRYAYAGSYQPETRNMPTQGIARYEGDVVYSYGGPVRDSDVELLANFGAKTVTGHFEDSHYGNVQVNARINGSDFNGQAIANGVKPATLSGKFYGVNANGVAGVFGNSDNTLGGAFGADRE